MIKDNEKAISKALHADLNRHEFESLSAETYFVERDILTYIDHVEEWAAGTYISD